MNIHRRCFLQAASLAVASLCLLATGCSKHDRAEVSAAAKDTYEETKAMAADAWASVKSFTFEQRDQFTLQAKSLSAKMNAQVSKVRADYSDEKASAARKAAMEELKNSETDYKQKVDALGSATAATWDSAKQNTIAAWDRLQAAYYKARTE
jgi:hypothetical protein